MEGCSALACVHSRGAADHAFAGNHRMKWITRERVKVDRVACPWLIRKFVDPAAEFLFVPADKVMAVAKRENATPYDVADVELGHHDGKCSFEAIVAKYGIDDPAIHMLAEIVHGADVKADLYHRAEAAGLEAIAEGFRHLELKDDHEVLEKEFIVYDALYAYCQQSVKMAGTKRVAACAWVCAACRSASCHWPLVNSPPPHPPHGGIRCSTTSL